MMYGLWDVVGSGWLGSDAAPFTDDRHDLARIGREVFAKRLGWPASRIEVREFAEGYDKCVTLDKPVMSARRALRELERGI